MEIILGMILAILIVTVTRNKINRYKKTKVIDDISDLLPLSTYSKYFNLDYNVDCLCSNKYEVKLKEDDIKIKYLDLYDIHVWTHDSVCPVCKITNVLELDNIVVIFKKGGK